jgi:four helix bundle protein
MKYERFEDLPVWKAAINLGISVYAITSGRDFRAHRSLRDQIERAAVSISNNIAEGFERGTTQELLTFLYIARGSAGEVRSMLCLLERLPAFSNLKSEISNLKSAAEAISRQLRAWSDFLQNSPIKGHRYLTEKSKRSEKAATDREEFLAELRRIQESSKTESEPTAKPEDE